MRASLFVALLSFAVASGAAPARDLPSSGEAGERALADVRPAAVTAAVKPGRGAARPPFPKLGVFVLPAPPILRAPIFRRQACLPSPGRAPGRLSTPAHAARGPPLLLAA